MRRASLALLCCLLVPSLASAEVTSLTILHRKPFADGQSVRRAGAYEQLVGIAKFAIDPKDKHNSAINDLEFAPKKRPARSRVRGRCGHPGPRGICRRPRRSCTT